MIKHIKADKLHSFAGLVEAGSEEAIARGRSTALSVSSWYQSLKPSEWTPPKRVIGPIQTLVYLLVSVSAWLVGGALKRRVDLLHPTKLTTGAWFAQLAVNLAWSGAFTVMKRLGASLYVIGGLWAAMAAYIVWAARLSKFAAWLLGPYLAWVSIASTVNVQFWKLNRGIFSQFVRR
jgi:translocator protein